MNPIPVPDGLAERLEKRLCSAILAERGIDALAPDRPATPARKARRWLWGAIPAVALASVAAVLIILRPPTTPAVLPAEPVTGTEASYANLERALGYFSDAVQNGFDIFSTPYTEEPQNSTI